MTSHRQFLLKHGFRHVPGPGCNCKDYYFKPVGNISIIVTKKPNRYGEITWSCPTVVKVVKSGKVLLEIPEPKEHKIIYDLMVEYNLN